MSLSFEFQLKLITIFVMSFWSFYFCYILFLIGKLLIIIQKKSIEINKTHFIPIFFKAYSEVSFTNMFLCFFNKEKDYIFRFLNNPKNSHFITAKNLISYLKIRSNLKMYLVFTFIAIGVVSFTYFNSGQMNYLIR
jgi:hypothetical protein